MYHSLLEVLNKPLKMKYFTLQVPQPSPSLKKVYPLLGQPSTILQGLICFSLLLAAPTVQFLFILFADNLLFCCLLPNHTSISSQGQTIKYFLKQKSPEKNYATFLGAKAVMLFVILTSIFFSSPLLCLIQKQLM